MTPVFPLRNETESINMPAILIETENNFKKKSLPSVCYVESEIVIY